MTCAGETLPLAREAWPVPKVVTQRGDTQALSGLLSAPR